MSTVHIESKKEDIAKKVIMPGDPQRAEFIANTFLTDVQKVNSVRGENAYTGYYRGERITVFSSGMGIPSMGIYSYELFNNYDVDYIIRVGTAGSYSNNIKIKDLFLADSSYSDSCFDTESINENIKIINASPLLNTKILEEAQRLNLDLKVGRVHTTEAFYGYDKINDEAIKNNALVVEMETYALFLNARKLHKHASSILTITDSLVTSEEDMSREKRVKNVNTMITLALETLIKL